MSLKILKPLTLVLFVAIIIVMIYAGTQENMFQLPSIVTGNIWFQASLWDVYTGLLLFYCWIFYKLKATGSRVLWFILLILLGNIATCGFVLWQILLLPKEASIRDLLLKAEG
jgi:hypothetical protein